MISDVSSTRGKFDIDIGAVDFSDLIEVGTFLEQSFHGKNEGNTISVTLYEYYERLNAYAYTL